MKKGRMLITGGAGFIGVNAAAHFARSGWEVTVLDNLSRRGSGRNLSWLQGEHPVRFANVDVRDNHGVSTAFQEARPDAVLHLAAQVAVTTSVRDPRMDFEINALGTFNVLEAVREHTPEAAVVYASTNKVYGNMEEVGVVEVGGRYAYQDLPGGASEGVLLDFHSPYGCSKGAADQYVLDYYRIYGICATSFRQSCIYGPHQFGVEDQGWVAWFTIAATLGRPITIYGDGKQVRDVLFVEDLIAAYELAFEQREQVAGKALNIGGGPANTLSLLELIEILENELGRKIPLAFDDWRPGDQKVFVCDISHADRRLGWRPKVDVRSGVARLAKWVRENQDQIQEENSL